MDDAGSLSSMLILSFPLALVGGVLLVLDGVKKQFDTRAFFGVMCVVWAGLMVGHHFNRAGYDGDIAKVEIHPETVSHAQAADPAAPTAISLSNADMLLTLDDQSVSGDEILNLKDTNARLALSCYQGFTIIISSKQALPQGLKVTLEQINPVRDTMLAMHSHDDQKADYFERFFQIYNRCDYVDDATVIVEGLQSQTAQTKGSASNKITVQLSKK
jgi:hypothetical protein